MDGGAPEVRDGQRSFRQLFVQRRGEPFFTRRFRPTKGMLAIADTTWSLARKSQAHRAAQQDFVCFPGDLQPWPDLPDVELVALHGWSASRLKIESLDPEHCIVRLTSVPTFRIGSWYKDERNPYYLENLKAALGKPGQWYLDRPAGTLTYLPLPGETPDDVTVVAPRLEQLVTCRGEPVGPRLVEHVSFRGLTFAHAEWPVPAAGYDVSQGQPALPSAIEVTFGRDIRFERCVVANTGAYGIGLGRGCRECAVVGCLMFDLGGGGVKVGEQLLDRNAAEPVLPVGNVVEDNTILHTGLIHYSANGIWCGVVRGTRIVHNEVAYGPYTGIAVGWCWDPGPSSCGDNLIEANRVHHVMRVVQDGGGIYTLGRQPGTIIRGNLVHDNLPGPFAASPGQCGLYFDEGSSGFLVEDNIQYNVSWSPTKLVQNQNTAADHDIRTNYLGVAPDDANYPRAIAGRAGVEKAFVWPLAAQLRCTPDPIEAMQMTAYPAPRTSFLLDFEDIPVGEFPRRFGRSGTTAEATLGVTDELAASGRRCLRFQDRKGLARTFYPYLNRVGWRVAQGPVALSFDLRRPAADPARLSVELRDYDTAQQADYWAGPSVSFLTDGRVVVGGDTVSTLRPDAWSHVTIRFALGAGAASAWEIEVRLPDGSAAAHRAPYASPKFRQLTGLVMCADGDADGVAYIDNLALEVAE
ncbi:MAG: right-handed parallel beta-helix repeat-containing protein [Armatimonadetes bacterium]|nr:right-handed parallel beta-helix repeat-containing protein [Armatimonadota bacterium]